MNESMKELNIKDTEFGYVHAVSGPGIIFEKFWGNLISDSRPSINVMWLHIKIFYFVAGFEIIPTIYFDIVVTADCMGGSAMYELVSSDKICNLTSDSIIRSVINK